MSRSDRLRCPVGSHALQCTPAGIRARGDNADECLVLSAWEASNSLQVRYTWLLVRMPILSFPQLVYYPTPTQHFYQVRFRSLSINSSSYLSRFPGSVSSAIAVAIVTLRAGELLYSIGVLQIQNARLRRTTAVRRITTAARSFLQRRTPPPINDSFIRRLYIWNRLML